MFNINLDKREFSKHQKGQVEYQNIIFWKEEQYINKCNDKDKYINIVKIHKAATNRTKGRNEYIDSTIRNFNVLLRTLQVKHEKKQRQEGVKHTINARELICIQTHMYMCLQKSTMY